MNLHFDHNLDTIDITRIHDISHRFAVNFVRVLCEVLTFGFDVSLVRSGYSVVSVDVCKMDSQDNKSFIETEFCEIDSNGLWPNVYQV